MQIHKITGKIYHISFKKQKDLVMAFLRLEEYHESSKFHGKIFSLKKFRHWYTQDLNKYREANYYRDWEAFNIPSHVLRPFYQGKFNPLSNYEIALLELLKGIKDKNFYIIGTCKNYNTDIKHEIAHGLFYTNSRYREEVLRILKKIDPVEKKQLKTFLIRAEEYSKNVLKDELNSYILADINFLRRNKIKISKLQVVHKELNKIFIKHLKIKK